MALRSPTLELLLGGLQQDNGKNISLIADGL